MLSNPLSEGKSFDYIVSSEAQSSVHNNKLQSSGEIPCSYEICNFEGVDAINPQAFNWVDTMPFGDTVTSYEPMNLDASASVVTFSQGDFAMVPETTVKQYPVNSILTTMNHTPDAKMSTRLKADQAKSKKGKARKKEKFDRKEQKRKSISLGPESGDDMKAACSSLVTQLPYERGILSFPATRPFEDYPQIDKLQGQASGVYSQKLQLQVDPQYYFTGNMPLCFRAQPPAMVQMPSYGDPTGMSCNPGFQPVLYSYPDVSKVKHHHDSGVRTPLKSKAQKKKHQDKSMKRAVLSPPEPDSQTVLGKQMQQMIDVGGASAGDELDPARIESDEKKRVKVKDKGKKTKGKGRDANIQRAEQKPKKKKKKKTDKLGEIGENPSADQKKRSTFFGRVSRSCEGLLQVCHCKQVDNCLRKVAPALWLQIVKGGACRMTHCCSFAWRMVCGGGAVKKVFSLLVHFASKTARLLHQLLRRILGFLQHLATSFFQFGAQICRCLCACSDKLIPNLTACISAPIKAILKCGAAIVSAPCRLLCSKKTGKKRRRR